MKLNNNKRLLSVQILLLIILLFVSFFPSLTRLYNSIFYETLIHEVNESTLSANVKIVQIKHETGYNSESTSVSIGSSGVIFMNESDRYFILTALHAIEDVDSSSENEWVIMGYDDPDYNMEKAIGNRTLGVSDYYRQFPEATIEYVDEKYDLAILSFSSDKAYKVLSISERTPAFGEKILTMSNPHKKRNVVSAGNVISFFPKPFGDKAGALQHPVIKHTASISMGSSGSALLNTEMEIVGINLGGTENLFRKFVYGMAMPAEWILNFITDWNASRGEI